MNWLDRLLHRKRMDEQLDKELRFHLEQQIADLVAGGLSPEEARRQANIAFGGPAQVQEMCREARGTRWVEDLLGDFRYSCRMLWKRPGFAVAAMLTLALGVGASTGIFSAVNPVLFKPLPYPDPGRIMMISERMPSDGRRLPSFGVYRGLNEGSHSLAALAAVKTWQPTITALAEPERVQGQSVSADYFRVLGVPPLLGEDFNPADDRLNGPRSVILSFGIWQRRFAGDSAIIGRQVTLDDDKYTVTGVMPRSFVNALDPSAELWTLLQYDLSQGRAWGHHLRMVARLKPGVGREQARRELDSVLSLVAQSYAAGFATAGGPPQGVVINSLQHDLTEGVRPALLAIFGAVLLVLIIASVNVTNLLLARGANRLGEFAMRAALGASRTRLMRQSLTESLSLALLGGALGLVVARLGIGTLVALAPAGLPQIAAIRVDAAVLVFCFAVTALIGMLVGLAPALQVSRSDVNSGLQRGSARATAGHQRMRRALVVAEVALALVLLVSAGLMLRSVQRVFAVSPGFTAAHVLTMQIQTSGHRFRDDGYTHRYFSQVLDAVRQVPGVRSAALTSQLPLSGDFDVYGVKLEHAANSSVGAFPALRYAVSSDYFSAMGISLRHGRLLDQRDIQGALPVAVISESLSRSKFGGLDPLGRRFTFGKEDIWYTIVGVVDDVKQTSLATDQSDAVYLPTTQWHWADGVLSLAVQSERDRLALAPAIRKAVWAIDKDQPIVRVATMDSLLAASEAQRSFALVLFEGFALAALLLAAVGIYGVLSGSVTERMREIGIRSALGASRNRILGLVLRQGIALTCVGVLIGLVGAFAASQALISLLFGTSPLDPLTYLAVILVLAGASVGACWLPAWRASRVDPSITLRAE